MKSIESKREREKKMVSQMIVLYCRKNHGTKGALCPECAAQDLLLQLQSSLLQAGDEGKNSHGYALFRPKNDILSSGGGNPPYD